MKKRYMETRDHKSIDKYEFKKKYIENKEFKGYIGFVNIINSLKEWYVPRQDGTEECILRSGYKWLELYPIDEKYAITALCDEECNVIEWYFDMIKEFGIENDMPYMIDLYLDLVITPQGDIYILDEDELKEALENNDITEDDYKLAHNTLDMLLKKYDNGKKINELKELTNKYLKEFME